MCLSESSDGVERVRVRGEIDISVIGNLDGEMRRAEATEASKIELDLAQRSRRNGRRLRIRPASSPQVLRVLELTGVVEHLPLET